MSDAEEYTQEWWMEEISSTETALDENWRTFADVVVERYLDKRTAENTEASNYNIFWSNIGIMKASLYAMPPKPMVARQNADANDDISRVSSNILERLLRNDLTKDRSELHACFREVVEDRLVPGLGQLWLRYDPTIEEAMTEEVKAPDGTLLVPAKPYKRIVNEQVIPDYVHWKDFLWSPARTWEEVWWVARRVYMRPEKFIKRFGKEIYEKLKANDELTLRDKEDKLPKKFKKNKLEVLEIWCRATKKVYFMTRKTQIEVKDDPLGLEEFFPCPKPLLATHTTNEFLPRPDYRMVQDQYEDLDTLTARISLLESALRVAGVYDKTNAELKQLLGEQLENVMIPVSDWSGLSEKKGLAGSVDWLPIDQIAKVLAELREQKREKIQEIYELTGMSDIMRGATNARETAAAQKIKAQYSSVRVQFYQQEVALFVQHVLRLKAEIVTRLFQPETIIAQSGIMFTPDAPMAQQAVQLLKDSGAAKYRIEVNEESLALPDYNQERDMRVEYLTTVGQFISQVQPLLEKEPDAAVYIVQMIKWVTSGFRGSKEIESVLDSALDALAQKAKQPAQPPPPDPEAIKQKAETERHSAKLAADAANVDKKIKADEQLKKIELMAQMILADKEQDLEVMKARIEIMSEALDRSQELQGRAAEVDQRQAEFEHAREMAEMQQAHEKEQATAAREKEKEDAASEKGEVTSSLNVIFDALAQLAKAQYNAQQQLSEIQTILKKKRVRIPQRDKNGDIVKVIDQLEE